MEGIEPEDTRTAEDAIAQHGFGTSDADQLTAARQEIDDLRAEVAHLSTVRDQLARELRSLRASSDADRERSRNLATAMNIIVRTVSGVAELTSEEIPF
jgi:pantothenate synthetase